MPHRTYIALLFLLSACATMDPSPGEMELDKQVEEGLRERDLAAACGYDFRIGMRSEAHKELLERAARDLRGHIVVMDWC